MQTVTLETSLASVEIAPALGGSVMRYDQTDGRPVFRPAPNDTNDPYAGCFPLIPWCNRISGGVTIGGTSFPIAPNRHDQALPIHGSAAQQVWSVMEQTTSSVRLCLSCNVPSPFRYDAEIAYRLDGAALGIDLSVTHRGGTPLPYGLGVHPWFPRTGTVSLTAQADGFIQTDEHLLPMAEVPVAGNAEWDFNAGAPLPTGLIDTCFTGWDGQACMRGSDGWGVDIRTTPPCAWYQVYSPSVDAGFFCFEPVTHPVDAHNAPGYPGLVVLSTGETASLSIFFSPV